MTISNLVILNVVWSDDDPFIWVLCLQREKCMALLKNLLHPEAELVIERMACWARLQLQDKRHISEEVRERAHKAFQIIQIIIIIILYIKILILILTGIMLQCNAKK